MIKSLKNRENKYTKNNQGVSEIKLSNLLCKFGLTCTLLPYVGEWKDWHLIMNLVCSKTRELWKNSLKGYQCLNRSIIWRANKSEIEKIFMKKFNISLQMTDQTNLFLILSCSPDVSFISETKKMRFPKMNKIELWRIDMLPIYYINYIPMFFKNCSQGKINEFILKSDLHTDMNFIQKGLDHAISNTIKLIKFENFCISQDTLEMIFSSLREAKTLKLINCMIDIRYDLKFNSMKNINLETLDLRRSLIKNSNIYINHSKWYILINALNNSSIRNSLIKIQCNDDEYPHQEIYQILNELDMKCIVSQN